jgi:translation initiation factor IF-2
MAATAGDKFNIFEDEKKQNNCSKRSQLMREQSVRTQRHITLDEIGVVLFRSFKELNVILKGC